MRISFSPQRRDGVLHLSKAGDVLTINGQPFDFSPLPEGGELPAEAVTSDLVAGKVRRVDGLVEITLILPHGPNPSYAVAFPEPVTATADGPIGVPQ